VKRFLPIMVLILLAAPTKLEIGSNNVTVDHGVPYAFEKTTKKKIELRSFWTVPPNIIICDRVATVSRVTRAVTFWKRMGYEFGNIKHATDHASCNRDYEHGSIRIMLPDSSRNMSNELAITLTSRIEVTHEAVSADIIIHSFAVGKELVLEHEIGHALGWYHINSTGHIMNPEYRFIGHRTAGVSNIDYIKIMYEKYVVE